MEVILEAHMVFIVFVVFLIPATPIIEPYSLTFPTLFKYITAPWLHPSPNTLTNKQNKGKTAK